MHLLLGLRLLHCSWVWNCNGQYSEIVSFFVCNKLSLSPELQSYSSPASQTPPPSLLLCNLTSWLGCVNWLQKWRFTALSNHHRRESLVICVAILIGYQWWVSNLSAFISGSYVYQWNSLHSLACIIEDTAANRAQGYLVSSCIYGANRVECVRDELSIGSPQEVRSPANSASLYNDSSMVG